MQRDPAPAYVAPQPQPRYESPPRPTYVPSDNGTSPPLDFGLLLIGGAIALIVFIVAISATVSGNSHARDIARIDRDIAKTNEITAKLEAAAREADAHVASMLAKARNGGRNG